MRLGLLKVELYGSFQELTVSDFFGETNPESLKQQQNGIKKKLRRKGFL